MLESLGANALCRMLELLACPTLAIALCDVLLMPALRTAREGALRLQAELEAARAESAAPPAAGSFMQLLDADALPPQPQAPAPPQLLAPAQQLVQQPVQQPVPQLGAIIPPPGMEPLSAAEDARADEMLAQEGLSEEVAGEVISWAIGAIDVTRHDFRRLRPGSMLSSDVRGASAACVRAAR